MELHQRSVKLNLSEALALFCPTYEDLEVLKQTLVENMSHAINQIKKEHYICGTQDEFDAWFRHEFGIGRKWLPDSTFQVFMEVRGQVQVLLIEESTREPKRAIKRIVQNQQHMLNPNVNRGGVTEMQIERARDYPLDELVDTRLFKATGKWVANCHCPLAGHEGEKTPSFYIDKQNHYKCFGCGGKGDSISYVMQRDGVNFIQAVKTLNRI